MKINNLLKNDGFKWFLIKLIIFLIIGISVQLIISLFFRHTVFFKTYLDIPSNFSLETANIRTILLNAFLFGIVASLIRSYSRLINIKRIRFSSHQWIFIFLSLCFLFGQYVFKFLINQNIDYFLLAPVFWGIIKILIIVCFVISLYLAVFGVSFTKYFLKNYIKEMIFFIVASVAFFILMLIVQNLWTYFSSFISNVLYHTFSLFFDNVTYKPFITSFTMSEGGGPLLGINGFKAIIGKPCSGIDSLLLFTSLYALIFIMDYKRLKKGLAITLFFVGAFGMFLVNILRIFLLFIVGAYWNPEFAISMFHTNAGWILFIGYFFLFWWIVNRFLFKGAVEK